MMSSTAKSANSTSYARRCVAAQHTCTSATSSRSSVMKSSLGPIHRQDRAYIIVCSLLGDTLSRSCLYTVYIIFTIEPLLGVSWPFLTLDLSQKTSVFRIYFDDFIYIITVGNPRGCLGAPGTPLPEDIKDIDKIWGGFLGAP
jgi:hypothetical protein